MVAIAYDENLLNNVDRFLVDHNTHTLPYTISYTVLRPYPIFYFLANDKEFEHSYEMAISLNPTEYGDYQRQAKVRV